MATTLIGKAPLTLVNTKRGTTEYVYAGATAPADITAEDAKRLVDEDYLVKVGTEDGEQTTAVVGVDGSAEIVTVEAVPTTGAEVEALAADKAAADAAAAAEAKAAADAAAKAKAEKDAADKAAAGKTTPAPSK